MVFKWTLLSGLIKKEKLRSGIDIWQFRCKVTGKITAGADRSDAPCRYLVRPAEADLPPDGRLFHDVRLHLDPADRKQCADRIVSDHAGRQRFLLDVFVVADQPFEYSAADPLRGAGGGVGTAAHLHGFQCGRFPGIRPHRRGAVFRGAGKIRSHHGMFYLCLDADLLRLDLVSAAG